MDNNKDKDNHNFISMVIMIVRLQMIFANTFLIFGIGNYHNDNMNLEAALN